MNVGNKNILLCWVILLVCTACSFSPPKWDGTDQAVDLSVDMPIEVKDQVDDLNGPKDMMIDLVVDQPVDLPKDLPVDLPLDLPKDTPPDLPTQTFMMCDGSRVDIMSDATHCGQCNNKCDGDFGVCRQGSCECTQPGMLACGDNRRCEDTLIDANHCGQCGFKCGAGSACISGSCVCRPGFTMCNGECVDTSVDPKHCGGCNMGCAGQACRKSKCRDKNSCEFAEGSCGRGDAGTACTSVQDRENDLYCRNNVDYGCGDQCRGDQFCGKLDLFVPRKCYSFRAGRGCDECPCADCSNDELCTPAIGMGRRVYCVTK